MQVTNVYQLQNIKFIIIKKHKIFQNLTEEILYHFSTQTCKKDNIIWDHEFSLLIKYITHKFIWSNSINRCIKLDMF